jgi:hypothetical protein
MEPISPTEARRARQHRCFFIKIKPSCWLWTGFWIQINLDVQRQDNAIYENDTLLGIIGNKYWYYLSYQIFQVSMQKKSNVRSDKWTLRLRKWYLSILTVVVHGGYQDVGMRQLEFMDRAVRLDLWPTRGIVDRYRYLWKEKEWNSNC